MKINKKNFVGRFVEMKRGKETFDTINLTDREIHSIDMGYIREAEKIYKKCSKDNKIKGRCLKKILRHKK